MLRGLDYILLIDRLHAYQGSVCALCGLTVRRGQWSGMGRELGTIDHVVPRSLKGHEGFGNIVLAHRGCNNDKADRLPTGCELIWLLAVNARARVEPRVW
jgi:5-methylcytosine-specific restriction endonuclease McrA